MNKTPHAFLLGIIISVLLLPTMAAAAPIIYEKSGPGIISGPTYDSTNDRYVIFFDKNIVTRNIHRIYSDSSYSKITYENDVEVQPEWTGEQWDNCKRYMEELYYDSSGNQVGKLRFYAADIVNDNCTSNYDPGTGSGSGGSTDGTGGSTCDNCALFECPGWDEYMSKLDSIKSAIPPEPNWQQVAATFRDTIAPRIKADLEDVLGSVSTPTPPDIPSAPSAPDTPTPPAVEAPDTPAQPSGLDDRGITAPTGEEAPGLDKAGFTQDDIKNNAPVIEERQDPTGGFKITDPIGSLPSQDDFKKNLPKPEEGEAPTPPDPSNPAPQAPQETENKAPTPTEAGNTAPIPSGSTNTAPIPSGSTNTAPIPSGSTNTAPIPSGSTNTAPIPSDSGGG